MVGLGVGRLEFANVPPQGTASQRHSHIPQDRILNKTTAATTSLSQISYAVNYDLCVSASGATVSPAHAQTLIMSLAGSVTARRRHSNLLSGYPGLDTKPSKFFLGFSLSRSSLHMQHTSSRLWSRISRAEIFLFVGASIPVLGTT